MEYPKYKKDSLGRVHSTEWSDSKATIKKYWGDTNTIKLIYTIYGNIENPREFDVDGFDSKGQSIITYSTVRGVVVTIPGFSLENKNNIRFSISGDNMSKWKNILKNK